MNYPADMSAFQPPLGNPARPNRRGALRHPVEVEGQLSVVPDARIGVVLMDISEEGCQIVRPADLTPDASIELSFAGFTPFHAVVVWTSPTAAGLRFDQPIHPALIAQVVAAAHGRKRPKRLLAPGLVRREDRERLWHLKRPVTFRIGSTPGTDRPALTGALSDLSMDGCRIASDVAVIPGTELSITIEGHEARMGLVRWCIDQAIGIQFRTPMAAATLESIALKDR